MPNVSQVEDEVAEITERAEWKTQPETPQRLKSKS